MPRAPTHGLHRTGRYPVGKAIFCKGFSRRTGNPDPKVTGFRASRKVPALLAMPDCVLDVLLQVI